MGFHGNITKIYQGRVRNIIDLKLRQQARIRFNQNDYVIITEKRVGVHKQISIRRVIKQQFKDFCPYCFTEQNSCPTEQKYLCINCNKLVVKNLRQNKE